MAAAATKNAQMAFEPDLAEGDDIVFFDKYGGGAAAAGGDSDVDDDSFDNGYYF